jgi:hypothetical protein
MKKPLFLFILAATVCQLKAQQTQLLKPADSLKTNLFDQYFKAKPNTLLQPFAQLNSTQPFSVVNTNVIKSSYDRMPIAFLQGDSKMPVIKLGGYSKMPILKLGDGGQVTVPPIAKTP